jgi:hypothetical protein
MKNFDFSFLTGLEELNGPTGSALGVRSQMHSYIGWSFDG